MNKEDACELADDLHSLANLIELGGTDLPQHIGFSVYSHIWGWDANVQNAEGGIPELLATSMRAGLKHGACKITKKYDDNRFRLNLQMPNERITYQISAERDEVCTKRVTGTEMVEKDVPPEGDWTKKMVEQDVVEWDCHPLLAVTKDD
jgi:hypothetical protein